MYESRIAADPPVVAAIAGFPPAIDALAAHNLSGHGFLRAAWYRGGGHGNARTVMIRREQSGTKIATIPITGFGPAIIRARKVAGPYWPFRSPLIAPDCNVVELAQALGQPAAHSALGLVWRLGPARMDDPATLLMIGAAQLAGWTVLSRAAGTSWVIDCDAAQAERWPRASIARKLRANWRKLEALGTPHWRHIRGDQWNAEVLDDLRRIESESWIAQATNGSDAKFLTASQRAVWQDAISDQVIAQKLSTTILMLDRRPIAFSFDLDDRAVRYSIAGSYVADLKRLNIGKLANHKTMDDAIAIGLRLLDMGAGDSGFKREMGAVESYQLADLLFVRSRLAVPLLTRIWGTALPRQATAHG